jgi:hypothetical protein
MKKSIKRLLCVMMAMAMAMSLMACGSKSDNSKKTKLEELSAEEVYNKMAEAAEGVDGVTASADMNVAATMSGMEVSVAGNMEVKTSAEPVNSYVKVDGTLNVLGQENALTYEVYEIVSDDVIDTYMYDGEEWTHEEAENDTELTDKITTMADSIDYSKVAEYFDSIESKISGNNYVLNMQVSSSELLSKLQDSEYASYLEDIDTTQIPELTISATVTVDGETFLPKTMNFSIEMEGTAEYQGMEIAITTCEFNLNYDSYGNVEITVPDEALSAE